MILKLLLVLGPLLGTINGHGYCQMDENFRSFIRIVNFSAEKVITDTDDQVTDRVSLAASAYSPACCTSYRESFPCLQEQTLTSPDGVALFMYDYNESEWVEASAEVSYSNGLFQIEKPLIGYEIELTSSVSDDCSDESYDSDEICTIGPHGNVEMCTLSDRSQYTSYPDEEGFYCRSPDGLVEQPFEVGEPSCEPNQLTPDAWICYLVVVTSSGRVASYMYPEMCSSATEEVNTCAANLVGADTAVGNDHWQADTRTAADNDYWQADTAADNDYWQADTAADNDWQADTAEDIGWSDVQSTTQIHVHSFVITNRNPLFHFKCKVNLLHYGAPTNMAHMTQAHADVYYRPAGNANWGLTPFLNLHSNGYNANNNRSRFRSTVHLWTLVLQGVGGPGSCFKCVATANGHTDAGYYPAGCTE